MKKLFSFLALLLLFGCAAPDVPEATPTPVPTVAPTPDPLAGFDGLVGLSLNGEDAMAAALLARLDAGCADKNYYLSTAYAQGSVDTQRTDVFGMLAEGMDVIVISPANIDEMDALISECETMGAPIVNILEPINGKVDVLIAPDYVEMGDMAARRSKRLLEGVEEPGVLIVSGDVGSFTMQMIGDGFNAQLGEGYEASTLFCDGTEEGGYAAMSEVTDPPDLVFTKNAQMALGVSRAMSEAGMDAPIVTLGGDGDVMEGIADGSIAAAIYFDPAELADLTLTCVQTLIADPNAALKKYEGLELYIADADDISAAYTAGEPYAHAFESE